MICPNCKQEIPDHSAFCPECGKQLEGIHNSAAQTAPEKSIRMEKKQIKIVIGVLVASCLLLFAASKLMKPTIYLNEYISVAFEGYDTVGTAVTEFDTEKFRNKYKGKLPSDFSDEYISYKLNKSSDLSNGDTVVLTWDCDDERALSRYGYHMKHEATSFSVTGLTEIGTFDPFDGIDITFEGISGNGKAILTGNSTSVVAQELTYSLDVDNHLTNGDMVTVSATNYGSDPTRYCIENYGLKPTSFTKEYQVEGLDEYVTSLSEITDESLSQMQQQATDVLSAYTAKSWDKDEEVFQGADYMGAYLLTTKDAEAYRDKNCLYLVYRVKIEHSYEHSDTTYHNVDEMYWYVAYKDLLIGAEGTVTVDVLSYDTPSNQVKFYPDPDYRYYWWYYGYATMDELFNDVVTANLEKYNYEDGILTE